jgi:hypothetical protein
MKLESPWKLLHLDIAKQFNKSKPSVCVLGGGELIAFRYHHNQRQQAKQQPISILLATHQV